MAGFNLNKVILGGRLTSDPELRQTLSGIPVCAFGIAVNRKFNRESEAQVDFINCIAWRQNAEFISTYFKKGSSVCITGAIQTRTWTDKQGVKRYVTEVIAEEIGFVDAKASGREEASSVCDEELPFF